MAYNNGFPVGYQPAQIYYPQPMQMQTNQPSQTNTGIIWVQGEAGAKSYLVAPNTTVQLWDSESQTIYLKSADASGMPSIKILDYEVRNSATQNVLPTNPINTSDFATKAEIDEIRGEIERLRKELGDE